MAMFAISALYVFQFHSRKNFSLIVAPCVCATQGAVWVVLSVLGSTNREILFHFHCHCILLSVFFCKDLNTGSREKKVVQRRALPQLMRTPWCWERRGVKWSEPAFVSFFSDSLTIFPTKCCLERFGFWGIPTLDHVISIVMNWLSPLHLTVHLSNRW